MGAAAFQQGADGPQRGRELTVELASDGGGAAVGVVQAEQDAQRRRLARAVRAEEAGDPAGQCPEADVAHGRRSAVVFGQVGYLDHARSLSPGAPARQRSKVDSSAQRSAKPDS
jgi:hypothetical protein